jgi:hypothetical protein
MAGRSRQERIYSRLSEPQQAEAQLVGLKGPPGPWLTHAVTPLLGRMNRHGLAGGGTPEPASDQRARLPTGGSQGNAGVIRGAPSGGPRSRGGRFGVQTVFPYPGGNTARDYTTRSRTGPAFHYGDTVQYDRHIMAKTGTEGQQAHPDSTNGQGNSPLADGPVRPVHMMVNRVMARRYGNTSTRHLDNAGPFATTTDNAGRPQPIGIQDGSPWSRHYGGTPGLTYLQGARGTTGVQSPVEVGAPGDGPQLIRGGVPHGLHSHAQPNAQLRTRRMAATPQQKRTRRSLPANSARAGQSWSQNAQRLGGQPVPVATTAGSLPGNGGARLNRG